MGDDIDPSGAKPTDLPAPQRTSGPTARARERLSAGGKANAAANDAIAFFQARSPSDRIDDLAILKDEIEQGIRTVEAAVQGIESITDLVNRMKGIARSAKSGNDAANRSKSAVRFNDLRTELDSLANGAGYEGINLIEGSPADLRVTFGEDGGSALTVPGAPSDASGLSIAAAAGDWGADADIDNAIDDLDGALTALRSTASSLGAGAGVLTLRLDFARNLIDSLEEGAAKLADADVNEKSANPPALQPRRQPGAIDPGIGRPSGQSILRLF
ncbi:MAG: hypothetical protein OXH94_02930 [Rhodospirillales bacterium]|nr:hypothetical protein [Rhodospirillales bacterium]